MDHMTSPRATDRAQLAREVVLRLTHVASAMRHHMDVDVARLGLTPAAARALAKLDPDRPIPSRDLAAQLECDRSNVTALVDKLEQLGLVERRTDPADRRVKTLVVTAAGRSTRQAVEAVLSDHRLLAGLRDAELRTLHELAMKISDGGCPADY
ncbi:MarR family winged helix-turn-helix transcriptional regulator [Rhizomonospora bruguierae]|uniref:MarR family winged helix-turn-helix transcriptional regulator n=1 Tax=Rhizomonospora bruguierae TaxID=1581705 RepID=UPI001BD0455A|nr:MarR family transcriptional regulator [Micromonospora sp. NBRC 107566]